MNKQTRRSPRLVGNREYGTWKDGSSVYKDTKGYYIVAVKLTDADAANPMYKKYLKSWTPEKNSEQLCFRNKRWTACKNKTKKRR
jgi:hypothetical protein